METVANSKGQITIPAGIRKQLGIKDGAFLQVDVDAVTRRIILTPLRGKYKGRGLMKALMEEKNRERNAEGERTSDNS